MSIAMISMYGMLVPPGRENPDFLSWRSLHPSISISRPWLRKETKDRSVATPIDQSQHDEGGLD